MYEKLTERDSLEDKDTHHLLSPDNEASYSDSKSSRSSHLPQIINFITFERLLILFLLAAVSICLGLIALQKKNVINTAADTKSLGTYGASDFNYMTLDHAKDQFWDDLSGIDKGLIWSADGNLNGKETLGMISMFHQLDCLTSFRVALQDATAGKDIGIDWNNDPRWPHCFDYLRRTILCIADSTIERPINVNGTRVNTISGNYDERKCGQKNFLYTLDREKAFSNYHP